MERFQFGFLDREARGSLVLDLGVGEDNARVGASQL